jgi:glycosyltransferase involved in cell wall biosynthesis
VTDPERSQASLIGKRPRVGLLSIHPAPYCDTTFNKVQARGMIHLEVLTLFEHDQSGHMWDLARPDYPNIFLGEGNRLRNHIYYHPNIVPLLRKRHYDVIVIPGYNQIRCQLAFLYALKTRTAIVFSADTVLSSGRATIVQYGKARLWRAILDRSAVAWVPGRASVDCLLHYGMAVDRAFEGAYTLDFDAISGQLELAAYRRQEYRQRLGITETSFAFLMVANLIPKRQHSILITAFSHVEALCPKCFLILVGSGPEKERLQRLCQQLGCTNIRFVDQVPFRQLDSLYVLSDAYVHSGSEAYSTAVAYAAISGHAVI